MPNATIAERSARGAGQLNPDKLGIPLEVRQHSSRRSPGKVQRSLVAQIVEFLEFGESSPPQHILKAPLGRDPFRDEVTLLVWLLEKQIRLLTIIDCKAFEVDHVSNL